MRTSVSVVFSILIAGSSWSLAHGNPAYSVTGVAIGSRVDFDSTAYQEYRCDRSEMFDGLTFCTKRTELHRELVWVILAPILNPIPASIIVAMGMWATRALRCPSCP